jgi:hypothetical protein
MLLFRRGDVVYIAGYGRRHLPVGLVDMLQQGENDVHIVRYERSDYVTIETNGQSKLFEIEAVRGVTR